MTPYSLVYVSKKAAASSSWCHIAQGKPVVDRHINRLNNIPLCIWLHNSKHAFPNKVLDIWIIRSEPLNWFNHKHLKLSCQECRIYRPFTSAANFVQLKSYKMILTSRYPQVSKVTTVFILKASESQISHTDTDILKSPWLQTWQQFHNHGVIISYLTHKFWYPDTFLAWNNPIETCGCIYSIVRYRWSCSRNVRSAF